MLPQGLVLSNGAESIRARAEPFFLMVTGVKSFVISNGREKSGVGCLNEKDRSLPMVEMSDLPSKVKGPNT